jgi:hypothetical protein
MAVTVSGIEIRYLDGAGKLVEGFQASPDRGGDAMRTVRDVEAFRLNGDGNFLMTPDEHRAAAVLLGDEAAECGDSQAAVLAVLHNVLAEAMQLRIDEQCPPTAPQMPGS